ncbi:DUF4352 domain-containing protein [Synechococcus sp. BA-124 BA4]|uniref:DUF4352 domain-containing protein n=1 Tax=unclassified Synechococcus TaxID=2626047 RepID=UPI002AD4022D|nr:MULTISPECIES: DUF4352 domain-containing protein [unclassified Synechococcus]MEA5398627.1 DUF4352 domain-containing protein [Synechococcus sp. BA-124 BA4]CAK6694695.1 hypothetical protein BBFGKLBO_01695 [Synechococcus sp. CBW1107]
MTVPPASTAEASKKPLSEKPLGYVIAVAGGLLGGPIGLFTSPFVLFGLTKLMKANEGKQPNRFLAWALVGIIGAPLSIAPINLINGSPSGPTTQSGSTNSESSSTSGSNTQPTESVTPLGTEQQIRSDRSLIVTGSEVLQSISSENQFIDPVESKGGKLVAVFVTIKNTGKESGNMFWSQFKLKDSQDRSYDAIEDFTEIMAIDAWAKDQGLADKGDQLFPGAVAQTVAVFRVAPDANGLSLVMNNNQNFAIK